MKHLIFIIGSLAIFASAELPSNIPDQKVRDNLEYLDGKVNAMYNSNNVSKNANGYLIMPNGIMFQWGVTGSINTSASAAVTFPKSFPKAVYSITMTRQEASTTASYGWSVGGITLSGFTAYSNGARAGEYYWIAIGN